MNKIKFGVSANKVGAITVYNYRIRTTANSILEQLLRKYTLYDFSVKHLYNTTVVHKISGCSKYTIFDFSSTDAMEFANIARQIDKVLLDAKIAKLNSRYNHLGTISFKNITENEMLAKEATDWFADAEL